MNNVSVICTAVTGESYCQSIRTGAYLLKDNLGLYWVVSVIGSLAMYGGVMVTAGLATLTAVMHADRTIADISDDEEDHLGVAVFFGSIIIVYPIVSVMSEALDSMFVFHCLQKRLSEQGASLRAPPLLGKFNEHESKER